MFTKYANKYYAPLWFGGGSRDPPGPVVRLEYLATMMMTVAPRRPLLSGSHAAQFTSGFG